MQRLRIALILVLALCLILAIGVQAMSSTNFQLNWFTPLTGGGGSASSSEYTADVTIGQTVIGKANSTNYEAGLGYWFGAWPTSVSGWSVYLPVITR